MINRVVVPVRDDGNAERVLRHAISLANNVNAHIIVTHCRLRPEDMLPYGVPMSRDMKAQIMTQSASVLNMAETVMRKEVEAICASAGVKMSDKPIPDAVTAQFIEAEGRQVDVVRRHGRLADIVVVAKPEVDRNLGANTLKAALFHTGRPVYMCDDTMPDESMGFDQIALCWDGSIEATRAVAQSLWLMKIAKKVNILTVGNDHVQIPPEELQLYLSEHDIKSDIIMVEASGSIGSSLMKVSVSCGAEIIILGAYGNNQYFERVLGGVTQHFVDHASRPLVLVH
tara:strand:+ start:811 stop:1665 length:855 start_codon:yes stop_codon:yes gene_type:complete